MSKDKDDLIDPTATALECSNVTPDNPEAPLALYYSEAEKRAIVDLKDKHRLTFEEIAQRLGRTSGAIRAKYYNMKKAAKKAGKDDTTSLIISTGAEINNPKYIIIPLDTVSAKDYLELTSKYQVTIK